MDTSQNPRLVLLSTANISGQRHTANYKYMIESIKEQSEPLDAIFASVYSKTEVLNFKECFKGLKNVNILKRSAFVPHFAQLRDIVKREFNPDRDWIIFTGDDGIWGKDRVKYFKMAIRQVENVSCIAIPTEVKYKKTLTHVISNAYHVNMAREKGEIVVKPWTPDGTRPYELHDLCVRFNVLKDFVEQRKDILNNLFCDVEFCIYATEYQEKYHAATSNDWTYFWRRADASYEYLSGLQFVNGQHGIKNAFDLVPYVEKIVEMQQIPSLVATAAKLYESLLDQVKDDPRTTRMLQLEYKNAIK